MQTENNLLITPPHGRAFLLDVFHPKQASRGVIVFAHGFKGFKDWGHWHLLAEGFAEAGYGFVKFNFSHNGTTLEEPLAFADPEAFGTNNYRLELTDLGTVVDWCCEHLGAGSPVRPITLIGHSRGGGISILYASQDARIKTLITWASVDNMAFAWQRPGAVEQWRQEGVHWIANARTGQQLPLYLPFLEDVEAHPTQYGLQPALQKLTCPLLIIHGNADPSVPLTAAEQLHAWEPEASLVIIDQADHVFGGYHPYPLTTLPLPSQQLLNHSLVFLAER